MMPDVPFSRNLFFRGASCAPGLTGRGTGRLALQSSLTGKVALHEHLRGVTTTHLRGQRKPD